MDASSPIAETYMVEEMKAIRQMVQMTVSSINNLQNISIVTTGGIYAFAVTNQTVSTGPGAWLVLVIPIVVNVLNYVLYEGMRKDTIEMRDYISKIEHRLLPEGLGYSRFYVDARNAQSPNMVKYARRSFWWLLIAASIVAPFVWNFVMVGTVS